MAVDIPDLQEKFIKLVSKKIINNRFIVIPSK